jgi:4'-phosphopantetheinyl transferase
MHYDQALGNGQVQKCIGSLSGEIMSKCQRFVRFEDKFSCVLGKLLLLECLENLGYPSDLLLTNWHTDAYGKPHIGGNISFSISHTEGCVVCAVSFAPLRVGIDIEKIKPINLDDFRSVLGEAVIRDLDKTQSPQTSFYRYWTAIESVLKADGRGFLMEIGNLQIKMHLNTASIDQTEWHLFPIYIDANYVCYLAASCGSVKINIQYLKY